MAKIVNISEIHPTLGFTEFDILEKYRKSFNESELGKLHSVFPFECMAKAAGLSDRRLGRRNRFSPSAKIAEGGNLAASKIRNLECPSYEICLIDYGCGKFNRKIHIMEQYP